ncbi:MAG TPA: hypothetical protein PKL13_04100 [bacterium]|nr:hypothetical protein [bacterium]
MIILLTGSVCVVIHSLKPNLVDVHIDQQLVIGKYHFEDGVFAVSIGEDRDIQTGAAVINFNYRGTEYRVEIPTDARVTKIRLQASTLQTDMDMIEYETDGFGSDVRISRIKKPLRI